jgi:hypothetical protein
VGAPGLLDLLDTETGSFQRIDNVWRPKDLFFDIQTQELLKDMTQRYEALKASELELKMLPRAELLLKYLRQLRLIVKRASFVRRANHLAFAQAVSDFYSAYGEVLRYLRMDQARGRLKPE